MPLYEYECGTCSEVVEILMRHTDQQSECPKCGDQDLVRVLSVPASPSIREGSDRNLPVAAESCGMPRCCGGGCQL